MERFSELDLIYLKKEEYNIYKKAHIIFYSKLNDHKSFLFLKKSDSSDKYSHITTSVLPEDNAPTFSIARIISGSLKSLFSDENINKILNNQNITQEDLTNTNEYHYHELWENNQFLEWLHKLSDKPMVQLDNIKGHQFYFYELPFFPNIDKLNENLANLEYGFNFQYFTNENISTNIQNTLNQTTVKFFQSFNTEEFIETTLKNINENKLERFFILSIKPAEGTKKDQAGFFHFPALFQGIYRKNDENWIYLVCSIDKLPMEKELENAKAIIIPGSHLSVYNDHDFLRKTEEWIKDFHSNHENVKFLGVCFGMQIYVAAMGGKVEKMKNFPFIRGPTRIDINEDFWNLNFVKKSGVEKQDYLYIMEAHGDECTFIPDDLLLKNHGKSDSCYNELLVCNKERIFLMQGHPEYHPAFNIERMVPFYLLREGKEKSLENIVNLKQKFYEEMNATETHSLEFRMICNSFLKN